jgi:hypothetical protein
MSPLEAAITTMNMNQATDASRKIQRAVLAEVPTRASQEAASRTVLSSYATGVSLEYYEATPNA